MRPPIPRSARRASAVIAAALSFTALVAAGPAYADSVTTGSAEQNTLATATVADVVSSGSAIHVEGVGFKHSSGTVGATLGVKLDGALTTEPLSGPVTNPATGQPTTGLGLWSIVQANADGTFSADITFPTPTNSSPALAAAWAPGTTHALRFLVGSLRSGDTPRSFLLTFTVGAGLVTTTSTAATGISTVAFTGGSFPVGDALSVKQGNTALKWSVRAGNVTTLQDTYTVPAAGNLAASVVFPAGTIAAGDLTLTITGANGLRQNVNVVIPPNVSFDKGTAVAATGTLNVIGLAPNATVGSITLGGETIASNLTADSAGKIATPYTIPAIAPISQPLVINQTAPALKSFTSNQAVYPDERPANEDRFTITPSTGSFYQGFYQSAYSAAADALFVTASDRGSGAKGFIYKLDPNTLEIQASKETVYDDFARAGAFGIGVDDAHGTVWVTNTGSASVAVYRASDLSLIKQLPNGTITHPRDVVYDPTTDLIFASSASEGSSATATGYVSVFEADDKNNNGTKYEKLKDIQTGTRDQFNPTSLSVDNGKLFSPSLGSNKVLSITTSQVLNADYAPTFLTVDGINVGGRGATGITYDAADNRVFIASQNSHEVVIANATTGATIKEIVTGRGALNVVWDKVNKLAYVSNFGGTSVTVLDADGKKVSVLPIPTVNHISLDGKGNAFAVDKATPNRVWKITPKRLPPTPSTQTVAVDGSVEGLMSLTLNESKAGLGVFKPGVAANYDATITGTARSTEPAQLTVVDGGSQPGYLLNGTRPLATPLGICATSAAVPTCAYKPLTGTKQALLSFDSATVTPLTIGLRQAIGANDVLATGTYGKTVTFTLSAGI